MTTPVLSAVRVDDARLIVRRKLPDDLTVEEFTAIVDSADGLCAVADWAYWYDESGSEGRHASPRILSSAQYGSPLEIAILVSGAIAGTLLALTKAVHHLADSVRSASETSKVAAEVRKLEAETERTVAETELLRLQIGEAERALRGGGADARARTLAVSELRASGRDRAASAFAVRGVDDARKVGQCDVLYSSSHRNEG